MAGAVLALLVACLAVTPLAAQDSVQAAREAVFGFQLNPVQHMTVDRWKHDEVYWWLDEERELAARDAVLWFTNYGSRAAYDSPFEDFVRQHADYFGVRLEQRVEDVFHFAADLERAPTVVPFSHVVLDYLSTASDEELATVFAAALRLEPSIPQSQHEQTVLAWQAAVVRMQEAMADRSFRLHESRANYIRNLAASQGGFVQQLSEGDYRYFLLGFQRHELDIVRQEVQSFLHSLPPGARHEVARRVLDQRRGWAYRFRALTPAGFEQHRQLTETEWVALGELELTQSDGSALTATSLAPEAKALARKRADEALELHMERHFSASAMPEKTPGVTDGTRFYGRGLTRIAAGSNPFTRPPSTPEKPRELVVQWIFDAHGQPGQGKLIQPIIQFESYGTATVVKDEHFDWSKQWEFQTSPHLNPALPRRVLGSPAPISDALEVINDRAFLPLISPSRALLSLINDVLPLACTTLGATSGVVCLRTRSEWRTLAKRTLFHTAGVEAEVFPSKDLGFCENGPGTYKVIVHYLTYSGYKVGIGPGDTITTTLGVNVTGAGLSLGASLSETQGPVQGQLSLDYLPEWKLTREIEEIDVACPANSEWQKLGDGDCRCVAKPPQDPVTTTCEEDPESCGNDKDPGTGGTDGADMCEKGNFVSPSPNCCAKYPQNAACWICETHEVDHGTYGYVDEDCEIRSDGCLICGGIKIDNVTTFEHSCRYIYDLGGGGGTWGVVDGAGDLWCMQYFHCIGWMDKTAAELASEHPVVGQPEVCSTTGGWEPCQDPRLPVIYPDLSPTQGLPACTAEVVDPWVPTLRYATDCPREGIVVERSTDLLVEHPVAVEPFLADQDNEIEFSIRNVGGEIAGNVQYEVAIAGLGTSRGWVGTLESGDSRRICLRTSELGGLHLGAGRHSVRVTVDADQVLAESDELNNTEVFFVEAAPRGSSYGPDLALTAGWIRPLLPVSGGPLEYRVTARNLSTSASLWNTEVRLQAERGGADGSTQLEIFRVDLGPGESRDLVMNVRTHGAAGGYFLSASANPERTHYEVDFDNNQIGRWVEVQDSADECLPCTSGDPNWVGARLCLANSDGTEWTGAVWQCSGVRGNGVSCDTSGRHPNGWSYAGPRCPDPSSLEPGWHDDACGNPGICPGLDTF